MYTWLWNVIGEQNDQTTLIRTRNPRYIIFDHPIFCSRTENHPAKLTRIILIEYWIVFVENLFPFSTNAPCNCIVLDCLFCLVSKGNKTLNTWLVCKNLGLNENWKNWKSIKTNQVNLRSAFAPPELGIPSGLLVFLENVTLYQNEKQHGTCL